MLENLVSWDRSLLLLLNGSGCPMPDNIFWTVTATSTWIPFFAILLYILYRNNDLRRFLFLVAAITLLVTATDMFSSGLCKPYFHRLRPTHNPEVAPYLHVVNGYLGGMYGFISSHAANTFGMALFLSLVFWSRSMSLTLFSWASLSTYSRLYLGVHYPADVFCGMTAGFVLAGGIFYLYRRVAGDAVPVENNGTGGGYRRGDMWMAVLVFILTLAYVVMRAAILTL